MEILIITNLIFIIISAYLYIRYRKAMKFFQRQIEIIKERGSLPKELRNRRSFPRVPGLSEKPLKIKFLSPPLKDYIGIVDNISIGGVAMLPKFPISRVKLDQDVGEVEIIFPEGPYKVDSARIVRIAHLGAERIIALKWVNIQKKTRNRIRKYIDEHGNP